MKKRQKEFVVRDIDALACYKKKFHHVHELSVEENQTCKVTEMSKKIKYMEDSHGFIHENAGKQVVDYIESYSY